MDRQRDSGVTGDDGPGPVDAREPFAILGHDIRLDIVLALLEDWLAAYTEPKSYAELMDAVDMQDSGKFNYHLEQLRGVYVEQVDDGYVPTASATALYRTVLAHRPTEKREVEGQPVDADCPACTATLELAYGRGFVTVECPDCDAWEGFTYPLPQNGFERHDPDDLLAVIGGRVRHEVGMARAGQCPDCAGPIAVDLRTDDVEADDHWVGLDCETCSWLVGVDLLTAVLVDDRVAAALRSAGLDPTAHGWQLPDRECAIESEDPVTVSVTVEGPEGTVELHVDGDLALESVAVDRVSGEGSERAG
jgi:hypothetical protein